MSPETEPTTGSPFKVTIVGGGVAGAEALLALRHLLEDRVAIELISGSPEMVFRPLAVAEPFGLGEARELRLDALAQEHGAVFREDVLAAVDPEGRTVTTQGGAQLSFDALLLAIGAQGGERMPGALSYDGGPVANAAYRELLDELESGKLKRIAFAAPTGLRWALPLYELVLLTAHHARERGLDDVELVLASEEARPLEVFGRRASTALAALLTTAGVEFRGSHAPAAAEAEGLVLANGALLKADRVVALPQLRVAPIPGIPQGPSGSSGPTCRCASRACEESMRPATRPGSRSSRVGWRPSRPTWPPPRSPPPSTPRSPGRSSTRSCAERC